MRKSEVTRQRLLKAAEALFIKQVHDGTSMHDLAALAGVPKSLVYYYFKNKSELFQAVLERYFSAHSQAMAAAMAMGGTTQEKLHAVLDAYVDVVERNPASPSLIHREICSNTERMHAIARQIMPILQWGTGSVGDLFPPEGPLCARHLFMSIFAMAMSYYSYAPLLKELWDTDPLASPALAERRQHLHQVLDCIVQEFAFDKARLGHVESP